MTRMQFMLAGCALLLLGGCAQLSTGSLHEGEVPQREAALTGRIETLLAQGRWEEADTLLQRERARLPASDLLEDLALTLEASRAVAAQLSAEAYHLQRARHLVMEVDALEHALAAGYDNPELQVRRQAIARERTRLAEWLAAAGSEQLALGAADRAERLLRHSLALGADNGVEQRWHEAEAALAERADARQKAARQQQREHFERTLAAARQARQADDFEQAGELLARIAQSQRNAQWQAEQAALEQRIDRLHRHYLEAGDRDYAEGDVEQALIHWRQAAHLRSDPFIAQRIDRAERFLERYRELRGNEAPRP